MSLHNDIKEIVSKHADSSPVEVLDKIRSIADLEIASILLHNRMRSDVYELFQHDSKSDNGGSMLNVLGTMLLKCSRVRKYHIAKSYSHYSINAEIEFSNDNLERLDLDISSESSSEEEATSSRKRKYTEIQLEEPVFVTYSFNEEVVNDIGPGQNGEENMTALEHPCKSISLTISACHGIGGMDACSLIDFQLLTAGHSPGADQILVNNFSENSDASKSDDEEISTDEHESPHSDGDQDSQPAAARGADFYFVNVSTKSLLKLSKWLKFTSVQSDLEGVQRKRPNQGSHQQSKDGCDEDFRSDYENHQQLPDVLKFLLSLPYVDEAWGIHDLVLDHELGLDSSTAASSEDYSSE